MKGVIGRCVNVGLKGIQPSGSLWLERVEGVHATNAAANLQPPVKDG